MAAKLAAICCLKPGTEIYLCFKRVIYLLSLLYVVSHINQTKNGLLSVSENIKIDPQTYSECVVTTGLESKIKGIRV